MSYPIKISQNKLKRKCNSKIKDKKYDDALMQNQANSILQGKWLGEYNSLTLVKGSITPKFIAILNKLHIPFLIGQELLYDVSCLFVYTFSKTIKNKKFLYIRFEICIKIYDAKI